MTSDVIIYSYNFNQTQMQYHISTGIPLVVFSTLATLAEAPANSKNIAFPRNDSLYSLTYYSYDPVLWCSLDSQSYHQLDPELNDHRNLIGIKLFQCHPDSRSICLNFLFEPRPFLTSQAGKLYHRWSWFFYFVNKRRSFLYELWA